MVTYLVHVTVQHEVYDNYVDWLKTEHIPEFLQVPGFLKADLCMRKGGSMVASSKEIRILFQVKDEDHLKAYMSEHAMKLREKGMDKFPGQFSTHREVWLETINFTSK